MLINKTQRDYDKEPIVIKNNFTRRVFEFTFLLIFNLFIVYAIFYSGVIDWEQKEWHTVLKMQMEKSFRFSTVLFGAVIINIFALISILSKNKKYVFKEKCIQIYHSNKELLAINLSDIYKAEKSAFPILATQKGNQIVYIFFILFFMLGRAMLFLSKIFISIFYLLIFRQNPYINQHYYILIFSNKTSMVLNIELLLFKDYELLEEYFAKTTNIDLLHIKKNKKISNFNKGINNG